VSVKGVVILVGRLNESVPIMIIPEREMSVWPSGRVDVIAAGLEVVGEERGGSMVNVSPSAVRVVGEVTVGSVTVSDPIITTPELEITV
jgi:hypothetical protein